MAKEQLKKLLGAKGKLSLVDVHRIKPKAEGGTYNDIANLKLLVPSDHQQEHGTLRPRSAILVELKSIYDARSQFMGLKNKFNNQLLACERRTDDLRPEDMEFIKNQLESINTKLKEVDKELVKLIEEYSKVDPLTKAALSVNGVGPMTVVAMVVHIDITKAKYMSSLWQYVGLAEASHKRYTKGKTGGGSRILRAALYNLADSMMKNRNSAYREVYDRTRAKYDVSNKIVKTRNTEGHWVESMWKDTKKSHRHGAALRAIMKLFLADYWYVGRTLAGLDTPPPYVQEKLGHTGITKPEERGWVY